MNTDSSVSTDAIIRYLNDNMTLVNARVQRLAQITSDGVIISEDELKNLAEANQVSAASKKVLEIFENTNWDRAGTRVRLLTAMDYLLDNAATSAAYIRVYHVVVRGLGDA